MYIFHEKSLIENVKKIQMWFKLACSMYYCNIFHSYKSSLIISEKYLLKKREEKKRCRKVGEPEKT